jgi:hypothetical protein
MELFRLNLDVIRQGVPMKSRDEIDKEYEQTKNKIEKERIQKQKDRVKKFSPENLIDHKKDLIMLLFHCANWILFIVIIVLQIGIRKTYSQSSVREIINTRLVSSDITSAEISNLTGVVSEPYLFKLSEIENTPELFDWISDIS